MPADPAPNARPKTAAERQRATRTSSRKRLTTQPPATWSEADCLRALSLAGFRSPDQTVARAAWQRLGELRGFVTVTESCDAAVAPAPRPTPAVPPQREDRITWHRIRPNDPDAHGYEWAADTAYGPAWVRRSRFGGWCAVRPGGWLESPAQARTRDGAVRRLYAMRLGPSR